MKRTGSAIAAWLTHSSARRGATDQLDFVRWRMTTKKSDPTEIVIVTMKDQVRKPKSLFVGQVAGDSERDAEQRDEVARHREALRDLGRKEAVALRCLLGGAHFGSLS